MKFILLFLLGLTHSATDVTTLDPQFNLSFDGFVVFLKELSALRTRHQKVKDTGKKLATRIDVLETAILETNMTIRTPIEKMTTVTDNTRNLNVRMKNITRTVEDVKQKMLRIQNYTSQTTQGKADLTTLADHKHIELMGLGDAIHHLTSSMHALQNTTLDFKVEKEKVEQRIEGVPNSTKRLEMMGCDSGLEYDHSGLRSKTFTVHFPRPFNAAPSTLYGLTQLHISRPSSSYNTNFNVTMSSITNSGLSVTVYKDSYSSLPEWEYNWMTCYI